MRIALFGANGQLGTALSSCLTQKILPLGSDAADVSSGAQVAAVLDDAAPDLVINASAYNLVDKAEDEPERAFAVNALGPRNLAAWCARHDRPLVHVSTDYVFGLDAARRTPWRETELPGPLGAYAVSKLAGEAFVQNQTPRHYVIRTCGLYGAARSVGKGNFIKTMLRLGAERGSVSVVDDQWCTPTSALDLARAIARLIETDRYGLYHATNAGATTWCRLAAEVFRQANMKVEVRAITTAEYPTKARRPAYSVLDSSKLAQAIGAPLPPWEQAVAEYLQQRGGDVRG
ncbi:MAG TPA: dTDP-4-dehydrorhamnose reductase [Planctomycetaceae bacterium]|jgi:dTDP-4-dehydrorhamnose reductase|nr:dTDP-4-dehydrorhamnose reductase [Planctomycetaceae bacterium]